MTPVGKRDLGDNGSSGADDERRWSGPRTRSDYPSDAVPGVADATVGGPISVLSPFLRLRLRGGRFHEGAVPLSLLRELSALEELIVAAARERFLSENPNRKRVPKGFTQDIQLKVTGIAKACSVVEISVADESPRLPKMPPPYYPYYERARKDICSALRSATDESATNPLHPPLLHHFDRIGRSLAPGETMHFESQSGGEEAVLTPEVRRKLLSVAGTTSITEETVLRGSVPEVDQARKTFELQQIGGKKLSGPLPEQHRETILEAFRGYREQVRIQMEVVGTFDRQQRLHGWEDVRQISILDALNIAAQLDELRTLEDGWLDGSGSAPPAAGLEWFLARFEQYYPAELPLPRVYPTPGGGAQLEWSLGSNEVSIEVDLIPRKAEWHAVDLSSGKDEFELLDLDTARDWDRVAAHIRRLAPSSR